MKTPEDQMERLLDDLPVAIQREADEVHSLPSDAGPAEVKAYIDAQRARGAEIIDCSFCVRMAPRPGKGPLPCPMCGAIVQPRPHDS